MGKNTTMNQIKAGIDLHNKNSIVNAIFKFYWKKFIFDENSSCASLKKFGRKAIINHNLWVSVCVWGGNSSGFLRSMHNYSIEDQSFELRKGCDSRRQDDRIGHFLVLFCYFSFLILFFDSCKILRSNIWLDSC